MNKRNKLRIACGLLAGLTLLSVGPFHLYGEGGAAKTGEPLCLFNQLISARFTSKTGVSLQGITNELTGEKYAISGDSFEIALSTLCVRQNEMRLTNEVVKDDEISITYEHPEVIATVRYTLGKDQHFIQKHLSITCAKPAVLNRVSLGSMEFNAVGMQLVRYEYSDFEYITGPKFPLGSKPVRIWFGRMGKGGIFAGLEMPYDGDAPEGTVELSYAPNIQLKAGEAFTCEPAYLGIYRKGKNDLAADQWKPLEPIKDAFASIAEVAKRDDKVKAKITWLENELKKEGRKSVFRRPLPSESAAIAAMTFPVIGLNGARTIGEMKPAVFDVRTFGACGSGKFHDTVAIQTAIDSCAENGGGTVFFPAGIYLTGTIHLKSNIHLYLDAGATILGSDDLRDYHKPKHLSFGSTNMDSYKVNQLIYGRKLKNVSITGRGTINCHAKSFYAQMERTKVLAALSGKPWRTPFGPKKWRPRSTLHLFCCDNVLIEGVTFTECAISAMQIAGCSGVNINRIVIDNDLKKAFLTDGIEIHASNNVNVNNSVLSVYDDPIAIYHGLSSELEEPLEGADLESHPNENITIRNVVCNTQCNLRVNGGTGGKIRNVLFDNVVYNLVRSGRARVFPVCIHNWYTGQWEALIEEPGALSSPVYQTTDIENIRFNNFVVNGGNPPFIIDGRDYVGKVALGKAGKGKISNISFSNCDFHIKDMGFAIGSEDLMVEDIRFDNVRFHLEGRVNKSADPSKTAYPLGGSKNIKRHMYNQPGLPQPLYFRWIDGLQLHNVEIIDETSSPGDWKGALRCDDVKNLRVENLVAGKLSGDNSPESVITLNGVDSAVIQSCMAREGTDVFLEVNGESTKDIVLLSNSFAQARQPCLINKSVKSSAISRQED